jgi:hypothetical protein
VFRCAERASAVLRLRLSGARRRTGFAQDDARVGAAASEGYAVLLQRAVPAGVVRAGQARVQHARFHGYIRTHNGL